MPAPDVLADEAFQRLEGLGASGGTELLPAAIHVLEKIAVHSAGRRTNVILITDGQMGNEEAIIRAFSSAAQVAVHTFGIDTAVNDAFLKSLARRHRGGCWLQTPDDDIAGTVSALGDRLKRPVLNNVAIAGSWETSDGTLPDLHAREVVTVALRGNAEGPIQITGCLPDGTPHLFTVPLGNEGSEAVKLLWAQQRIEALLASGRKQEAIALAKAHNLICEGAAFIAWDEQEQGRLRKTSWFSRHSSQARAQEVMRLMCCFPVALRCTREGITHPKDVHQTIPDCLNRPLKGRVIRSKRKHIEKRSSKRALVTSAACVRFANFRIRSPTDSLLGRKAAMSTSERGNCYG